MTREIIESGMSRRSVLAAAASIGGAVAASAQTTQPAEETIARVPLGKTGAKVSRLGMGASFPEYGPRLLEFAYRQGIAYFDNSDSYVGGKAEALLGEWAGKGGHRDDVFVIAKSHAYDPETFYRRACQSHERMKLETIDLYMIHALQHPEIPLDADGKWRKVKERLVREKRIRFAGFSTHAEMQVRSACLKNAAQGGWVDALLVACDPSLIRANPEFDKALDACAKAGVGLIAMKSTRGLSATEQQPDAAREAFGKLGLTPHQAMQAGLWSDGRFACVCSEMINRKIIEENAAGARAFRRPFDADQRKTFQEGMRALSRATCPGCDGSCRQAAGTPTDFCSIARYLSYFEQDGKREAARDLYARLPEPQRAWRGADLGAASRACPAHLDFEGILDRAERHLA